MAATRNAADVESANPVLPKLATSKAENSAFAIRALIAVIAIGFQLRVA
jgi:hypothetical protein